MSTQLIGFSIGGTSKRFVVATPSMIWPETLTMAVLFNTLHGTETSSTQTCGGISREQILLLRFRRTMSFTVSSFCLGNLLLCCASGLLLFLDFLPSYLFTALSELFTTICWIVPNNAKVNQLFGISHGLAIGILTFDWGQIVFNGSPFPIPWWAAANVVITIAFFYWFVVPHSLCKTTLFAPFAFLVYLRYRFLQYTNVWYSAYLPLLSSDTFDNTGKQYNVSQIINPDSSFNLQAYKAYSPIFLSASFTISYGLAFATITATHTHTFLYYGKYIWSHARRPLSEQPDIHARLMSVYKEVPHWWYLTVFGLRHYFY